MTEVKISKKAKYNAETIKSLLGLAFGTVVGMTENDTHYTFEIEGYRKDVHGHSENALINYLGVDSITFGGRVRTYNADQNGVLRRREYEKECIERDQRRHSKK